MVVPHISSMKTKKIFLLIILLALTSLIFVIFGSNQQASIQNLVSETHKRINKLKLFKENLKHPDEKQLFFSEKHIFQLGFHVKPFLFPHSLWTNTSVPVVVTYVKNPGHEKQVVGLLRSVQHNLPDTTVLIYNLGVTGDELQVVQNYCENSRCMVFPFSLESFPSHVSDDVSHAFRPIIIQDALNKAGGVLFMEPNLRILKPVRSLLKAPLGNNNNGSGVIAWATRQATSSITHPNMFGYFHTSAESFLFLPMVEVTKLLIYNTADIHYKIMLPWVQCALTEDCIFPIGAQSGGCHFNKKPQYRYSGCHGFDASAFNIVLGLHFDFDSSVYTFALSLTQGNDTVFKELSDKEATLELNALEGNNTSPGYR